MKLRWKIAQYFEAWWWRRYLRSKPTEEYLRWKRDYWKEFLNRANLGIRHGAAVLDAGCGPAGIFLMFPDQEVVAVDPLLGKYRPLFPHFQNGSLPNVRFQEKPLEQFAADREFDLIFCLNVINHVADPDVCLQNFSKAIKKNGRLALTVDAHNFRLFKFLFRLIPGDILHPHQLDRAEYLEKLERHGFYVATTLRLGRSFFFDYYLFIATPEK